MNITILGEGFIGTEIRNQLKEMEHQIKSLSSKELDLTNYLETEKNLPHYIKDNSFLIFTAAITRLRDNSFESYSKNLAIVENIARLIEQDKLRILSLVFLSTVDVYGFDVSDGIIRETLPTLPPDYYALSKLACEQLLRFVCEKKKIPLLILRIPGVFGPGDTNRSTLWKMVSSALQNNSIKVFAGGKDIRDFLYVNDLIQLIRLNLLSPQDCLINASSGMPLPILDIAHYIAELTGATVDTVTHINATPSRAPKMVFDLTLLKNYFPTFTPTSLFAGIKDYTEYQIKTASNTRTGN
ncbi:MAG: NAD(P)-dependent oxidoreductase [Fibrobacterota bacterium]|nr:NAD(P)-dependent oxidoreductase [Fibrobacterota bacterium]